VRHSEKLPFRGKRDFALSELDWQSIEREYGRKLPGSECRNLPELSKELTLSKHTISREFIKPQRGQQQSPWCMSTAVECRGTGPANPLAAGHCRIPWPRSTCHRPSPARWKLGSWGCHHRPPTGRPLLLNPGARCGCPSPPRHRPWTKRSRHPR